VDEARGLETAAAMPEATYHPATETLNLEFSPQLGGQALADWIRWALKPEEPNRAMSA
jgi:hypothetical protein